MLLAQDSSPIPIHTIFLTSTWCLHSYLEDRLLLDHSYLQWNTDPWRRLTNGEAQTIINRTNVKINDDYVKPSPPYYSNNIGCQYLFIFTALDSLLGDIAFTMFSKCMQGQPHCHLPRQCYFLLHNVIKASQTGRKPNTDRLAALTPAASVSSSLQAKLGFCLVKLANFIRLANFLSFSLIPPCKLGFAWWD